MPVNARTAYQRQLLSLMRDGDGNGKTAAQKQWQQAGNGKNARRRHGGNDGNARKHAENRVAAQQGGEVDLQLKFQLLSSELESLSVEIQRSVTPLLGLIIGDSVGLPYELRGGIGNRQKHDMIASNRNVDLKESIRNQVHQRLFQRGKNNIYARSYSDDTVIADLKMSSVTHCAVLAKQNPKHDRDDFADLWNLQLAGLLAWNFGEARGKLFQGAGRFTKDLLQPHSNGGKTDSPCCAVSEGLPACKTWPREWFIDHARRHLLKGGGSWGNGTVMSYAPQVLAERIKPAGNLSRPSARALENLANMHQHEHARAAHDLLHNILESVQTGSIQSCGELAKRVRSLPCLHAMMKSKLVPEGIYPLRAFYQFLQHGDCSNESMMDFVRATTGLEHPKIEGELHAGYMTEPRKELVGVRFGRLLRTLSNWDDNHSTMRLRLRCGEDVRFSQRGLNSVLIAIWCCCGAESTWDWIARLLYVGGDTDTIGAICGQIASPLFPCSDILDAFRDLAAVGVCRRGQLSVRVAAAAALRFFQRSLLFCKGDWAEHASGLRLVDPNLVDIASSETAEALQSSRQRGKKSGKRSSKRSGKPSDKRRIKKNHLKSKPRR